MKQIIDRHKYHWRDRKFLISVFYGLALLAGSLFLNFYAGTYAALSASNFVTDIILSNIKVYDLSFAFVYGPFIFWILITLLAFSEPKRLPFTLKSVALFIIIRAIFISLTHIGPFPSQIAVEGGALFDKFTFGGDLFFSGHTGLPFLLALVFWQEKSWRNIFIVLSIFFGAVVLLMHMHYSIDVLAAFFITYSIFRLAEKIFPRDRQLFLHPAAN